MCAALFYCVNKCWYVTYMLFYYTHSHFYLSYYMQSHFYQQTLRLLLCKSFFTHTETGFDRVFTELTGQVKLESVST